MKTNNTMVFEADNMKFFLLIVLPGLFIVANGKQNAYVFIPEYSKVSYVNPLWAQVHDWSFKKFNKTTGAFSLDFTFKKDIDNSLYTHMTGFMFKNNEFKKTALDFNLRICPLFEDGFNFDIGHVLENSNLTMKCPIKKGTYYVHNIIPDASNFPPLMPSGKWMYRHELNVKAAHFATLDLIWRVEYPSL